jgi:hypothetical protein
MAVQGPTIKSFGTFAVFKHGDQSLLTLTKNLDNEPFPISAGSKIKVEQVVPDDDDVEAYLRLIPVSEG